jgi:hypothetical protein
MTARLPKRDKCLRCQNPMTWADQRRQYGRAMRAGMTVEEARRILPRCQKCMTVLLHAESRGL